MNKTITKTKAPRVKTPTVENPPAKTPASILDRWTKEELQLIRSRVAPNCPDDDLRFFATICFAHKLDPFLREIHFVPRQKKENNSWTTVWTVQIGIDGYRKIAARTGSYAGSDEPVFVEGPNNQPKKATVTVWRMVGGVRCPFTASALLSEYMPNNEKQAYMWKARPYGQLAKCAEALALRKGFPEDLSGLYIEEEMQRGEDVVESTVRTMNTTQAMEKIANAKTTADMASVRQLISAEIAAYDPEDQSTVLAAMTKRAAEIVDAPAAPAAEPPAPPPPPAALDKASIIKKIGEAKTEAEIDAMKPEIARAVNAFTSAAEKDEVYTYAKHRKSELAKIEELKQEADGEPLTDPTVAKPKMSDADVEKLCQSLNMHNANDKLIAAWNAMQDAEYTPAQYTKLSDTFYRKSKSLNKKI